jgi:hypothetical protein
MGVVERLDRLDDRFARPRQDRSLARLRLTWPGAQAVWDRLEPDQRIAAWSAATSSQPPPSDADVDLWLALIDVAEDRALRTGRGLAIASGVVFVVGMVGMVIASTMWATAVGPLMGLALGGLVGLTRRMQRLREHRLRLLTRTPRAGRVLAGRQGLEP